MSDDVNLEEFVMTKDEFSGADIKAICTEAGLLALRERRMKVRLMFVIRQSGVCCEGEKQLLSVVQFFAVASRS